MVWKQRSKVWIPKFITESSSMLGDSVGSCIAAGEPTEEVSPASHPADGLATHETLYFGRNVKYALVLLTVVQVKHTGPDSEQSALFTQALLSLEHALLLYAVTCQMLKRHILKNNKHSSVPFWWPRGSWVYSARLSASPAFFWLPCPQSASACTLFFRPLLLAGPRAG